MNAVRVSVAGIVVGVLSAIPFGGSAKSQEPAATATAPSLSDLPILEVGKSIDGEVTATDPIVATPTLVGSYTDGAVRGRAFQLRITTRGTFAIELRSYFFDSYLVVRDEAGEVVAEDDDSLLPPHARIVLREVQAPKSYRVECCALHGGTGPFRIAAIAGEPKSQLPSEMADLLLDDAREGVRIAEAARGRDDPATARNLVNLALALQSRGIHEEVPALCARALAIFKRDVGPENADTVTSLNEVAVLLIRLKDPDGARILLEQARSIDEKLRGSDSPHVAAILNNLAAALSDQARYEEARANLERALKIRESNHQSDTLEAAIEFDALAQVLYQEGKNAESLPRFQRALEIRKAKLAPDDPSIAKSLNNLAVALQNERRFEDAKKLLESSLEIRRLTLDPEDPEIAVVLSNIGTLLMDEGSYDEAGKRFDEALTIQEKRRGPESIDAAYCLINIETLLYLQNRFSEALQYSRRSFAIFEKTLPPKHPDLANALIHLGDCLYHAGDFEEALQRLQSALTIRMSVCGPDSQLTAVTLSDLGSLLTAMGRYEDANSILRQAVDINEKLGLNDRDAAACVGNFATLLVEEGNYEEARNYFERSQSIVEKTKGLDCPDAATCFNNLATMYLRQGNLEEARRNYERALTISEESCGMIDESTAANLCNLAAVLIDEGDYETARKDSARALNICESVLKPDHPSTAVSLDALARSIACEGRLDGALKLGRRALSILVSARGPMHPDTVRCRESLIGFLSALGSNTEAREVAETNFANVLANARREELLATDGGIRHCVAALAHAFETLASTSSPDASSAANLFERSILVRSEGFHLQSGRRRQFAASHDPALRMKLERLQAITAELSNLFSMHEVSDSKNLDERLQRLRKEREHLERDTIAMLDARPEFKTVTSEGVRSAIPAGAALIVMAEHRIYEPIQLKDGAVVRQGKWSEPHTTAWVAKAGDKSIAQVDLGPSASLTLALQRYFAVIKVEVRGAVPLNPKESRKELAAALRHAAWDPLQPFVGDAETVFLVPDGPLATLPFGIIEEDSGHHLLEKHAFVLVDDLERFAQRAAAPAAAAPSEEAPTAKPTLLAIGGLDYRKSGALPEGVAASTESRGGWTNNWRPLSETRHEVDDILKSHEQRFPDAQRLELKDEFGTEERVKAEMPRYSTLHFATHGYFKADGLKSFSETLSENDAPNRLESTEHRLLAGYWPEFLCGLVCSGAMHPGPDRDNGLLTGEEIGGLDLRRCDLAVLSACETALGQPAAGDGLLSLTRAFREAGARTVISSLWSVNDASTRMLMLDFYDRLWNKGESKLDALRHAQLAILEKNLKDHKDTQPATWGAFILTGETR